MTKLSVIEGIGPVYQVKLNEAGVRSIEALRADGATPAGRRAIAEKADISQDLILEWVNRADLMRIGGIGEEYSDLLEVAGVDTVPELAQRNPGNLFAKLGEVNADRHLVRRLPSLSQVEGWVAEANELPRVITY